jgi:hypothetical protein
MGSNMIENLFGLAVFAGIVYVIYRLLFAKNKVEEVEKAVEVKDISAPVAAPVAPKVEEPKKPAAKKAAPKTKPAAEKKSKETPAKPAAKKTTRVKKNG